MKKKIEGILAFLLVIFIISAAPCAFAADGQPHTLEMKTYPFLYCFTEGMENSSEMNLYFVDGGDIPYVELSEFIPVLAELYNTSEERDESNDISFELQSFVPDEENSVFIVTRPDNNSSWIIQPGDNTMTFMNYNSFSQKPGSSALVRVLDIPDPDESNDLSKLAILLLQAERDGQDPSEIQMQFFTGVTEDPAADHSFFVATNRLFNRRGKPLTMSLGDYDIEIVLSDGKCYLPLQTMSDVFFTLQYVYFIFNGEKVIADVYKGTLQDQAYEAEPVEMSQEFAMFNYRELCFFLDHFYGLKPEHRIEDFSDFIAMDAARFPQITGTDSLAFDSALNEILLLFFDDSHSALVRYSWRTGVPEGSEFLGLMSNMGYSTLVRQAATSKLTAARSAVYPNGVPGYEEIGDTAFITFDSFTANRPWKEYYELEDPDNPQDTIELIMYANRQIRREGSPVKNIVLDLSLNGGGNSDAAIAVASWFAGEAKISLRDTMTGAETIASYRTDLNVNGVALSNPDGGYEKYDPGDTVSKQYNLFCLISSESFSCGNLVPALFSQVGGITLIGQRSGGGSNAVLPASTASGFIYQISGPLQITTYSNGSLYGVDTGVEPHVRLNFYESFYDREGLVEMIHNMK